MEGKQRFSTKHRRGGGRPIRRLAIIAQINTGLISFLHYSICEIRACGGGWDYVKVCCPMQRGKNKEENK
jgi:hypothetical protein